MKKPALRLSLDHLEPRLVPSVTIVNARTATFTDVDGDLVEIKVSKGTLTAELFTTEPTGLGDQLQEIELQRSEFIGADLSITSVSGPGDGLVHVGFINSLETNLGSVFVDGDLGRIYAGAGNAAPGLKSLTVDSMGRFGTTTQAEFGSLGCEVIGLLGKLEVQHDVDGQSFFVGQGNDKNSRIGSIRIGGSLIGGTRDFSGAIIASGSIGQVFVGGDIIGGSGRSAGSIIGGVSIGRVDIGGSIVAGNIFSSGRIGRVNIEGNLEGGSDDSRGGIIAFKSISSVSIGGSVIGGSAKNAGQVYSESGGIGPVSIGGSLIGGSAPNAGQIFSEYGGIGPISIGESLVGGSAPNAGQIFSEKRSGTVSIVGDVIGGTELETGAIRSNSSIGRTTIGGSMVGGSGMDSAVIKLHYNGKLGRVTIGGRIEGGAGHGSGSILAANISSVSIGGSLIGGTAEEAGQVYAYDRLGPIVINGDLIGGTELETGVIKGYLSIKRVAIGGSVVGGSGSNSAVIFSDRNIGHVMIGGEFEGGSGRASGRIRASRSISSLTIGGSLIGGAAEFAGQIFAFDRLGPISIKGDMIGGTELAAGLIQTYGFAERISIGGSLIGGSGTNSAQIYVVKKLGRVKIDGDIRGGTGSGTGEIACDGPLKSVTLGGSLVGGQAENSGVIFSRGRMGQIDIAHDIIGGSISGTMPSLNRSGFIECYSAVIDSVTIGGSIISGVDTSTAGELASNATIRSGVRIKNIRVEGDIVGNSNPDGDSPVIISAGQHANYSRSSVTVIDQIFVEGKVERAKILAGYNPELVPVEPDARIGSVTVGGDWICSSIVAGIDSANGIFGDGDDHVIDYVSGPSDSHQHGYFSRIGQLIIGGTVSGTPDDIDSTDAFAITAQHIGLLIIAGQKIPLTPGKFNDLDGILLGETGDVWVIEHESAD